jgi:hypothetical protein
MAPHVPRNLLPDSQDSASSQLDQVRRSARQLGIHQTPYLAPRGPGQWITCCRPLHRCVLFEGGRVPSMTMTDVLWCEHHGIGCATADRN